MPEMVWLDPEIREDGRTNPSRRFSGESNDLRDLRHLRSHGERITPAAAIELAGCLARGFRRLAERPRNAAVSCPSAEQNHLEVSRPESPDERVVRDVRRAG